MAGDRMLGVLDFFTPECPLLTAEEVAGRLGCSTATAYRYIARLCAAGLLARFRGAYALGPRVIELDHTIRQGDPLLHAAQPVMCELRDVTGCDVLVASMYGARILAVHHERGTDPGTVAFGRGRLMPLFRGAGSRMLVASLPAPQQKRLYNANRAEAAAAGLGEDWKSFRAAMEVLRRAGHALSLGELEPQNVGVAAPIGTEGALPASLVPASLVLVLGRQQYAIADKALIAEMVMQAAGRIAADLDRNTPPAGTVRRRTTA
jgi:DNA-binding IclR family transcriptional regulator